MNSKYDLVKSEIKLLADNAKPVERNGPVLVCMAEIEPKGINWLWPGYFACGKVSILSAIPGIGKSTVTTDIAARVSVGSNWPVKPFDFAPCGSVVLLSAEDDPADTIRPRLDAAGADAGKIHVLKSRCVIGGESVLADGYLDLSADLNLIEQLVSQLEDCRLLIIDPISSYFGRIDSYKDTEVRRIMTPLGAMAAKLGVSVICVSHVNKASGQLAVHRTSGSGAIVAAARGAFLVGNDPDDKDRKLILPAKLNIAPDCQGLAYRLKRCTNNPQVAVVDWEADPVSDKIDRIFGREFNSAVSDDADGGIVTEVIQSYLGDGLARSFKDIAAEVKEQAGKIGDKAIRQALKKLGAQQSRDGFQGNVTWSLSCE